MAGVRVDHLAVSIYRLAHVVATVAQLRQLVAVGVLDGRQVGRGSDRSGLSVVRIEEALFNVVGVGVGARVAGAPGILAHERAIGRAAEGVDEGVRRRGNPGNRPDTCASRAVSCLRLF